MFRARGVVLDSMASVLLLCSCNGGDAALTQPVTPPLTPRLTSVSIDAIPSALASNDSGTLRIVVRVRDEKGDPMSGQRVTARVTSLGAPPGFSGSPHGISPGSQMTGTDGRADFTLEYAELEDTMVVVTAEAGGLSASASTQVLLPQNAFRFVSTGYHTTCAITKSGELYCWGANEWGQAGQDVAASTPCDLNASFVCVNTPQRVALPEPAESVDAGLEHACAVSRHGNVFCWGYDTAGVLGNLKASPLCRGLSRCSGTPVRVSSSAHFSSVSAGSAVSCAIASDQRAYCWGSNQFGQVVPGAAGGEFGAPVLVDSVRRWRWISAQGRTSCGVTVGDALYCWGLEPSSLSTVVGMTFVRDVVGYTSFSANLSGNICAMNESKGLSCGLGIAEVENRAVSPATAAAPYRGTAVGALGNGRLFACVVDGVVTGGFHCHNSAINPGVLFRPMMQSVSVRHYHACGVSYRGAVECQGYNGYSQMGSWSFSQGGGGYGGAVLALYRLRNN